ncbi:MAG TPA: hypothetical protein VGS13_07630, partial [Stellaceae bacterium]|nr:hypothetical protein [Stellaceae bacterium]
PLAGSWRARPRAPWQVQVAPAMERIVKAEAAAMRVTLAVLVAEINAPTAVPAGNLPVRAVADGIGSE